MRDDPGIDRAQITTCLSENYGIRSVSQEFLSLGYDANASVYRVTGDDGALYFLKIRNGPVFEPALEVPRALIDVGIRHILAPLRSEANDLWCWLDDTGEQSVVVFPFVLGEDAVAGGLTDDQWREFGTTLRAVHDSDLAEFFRGQILTETFSLPSAAVVRKLQGVVESTAFEGVTASQFADFWRANAERIDQVLTRAEGLGRELQAKTFNMVLCHADIHAANILVDVSGDIWLVDWDDPVIAPRERDLLFVIESRIARLVTPREEDQFFQTYGPTEIDPVALIYFRYERLIQDLGEFGESILLDNDLSEQSKRDAADLAMSFFAPGGDLDHVERIDRYRWG